MQLGIAQPWVSFGSDAEALAPEGVFLKSSTHPRAYGNFARVLGKYVRDEKRDAARGGDPPHDALPATNWKLQDRGCIDPGCYADVVVFDPATIADKATFDQPHAVRDRRRARAGQRRAGDPRRRAHGRETRAGRARPGLAAVAPAPGRGAVCVSDAWRRSMNTTGNRGSSARN